MILSAPGIMANEGDCCMWPTTIFRRVKNSGRGDTVILAVAWDRNLTDDNGPYIELMTGVFTDNQPRFYLACAV
ncbi:TPR-domain protein [Citrobacter koseri]|uniref:TPR-domain protein n=1 Tax=Citrobacter koseri TaxID=545 RepID=A0A2X2XQZ3_CITKO|nr:TPR-domain protein [Citrobacter koseri]